MSGGLQGFLLAMVAAYGVFLVYTAVSMGWRGLGPSPAGEQLSSAPRPALQDILIQAGLEGVTPAEFIGVAGGLLIVGFGLGFALFGALVPSLVIGVAASATPIFAARARRARRLDLARDAWPRLIEEIRIQAVSLGRSIPQALFTVGRRAPEDMQSAFDSAHREWLISTDFDRTLQILKSQLADPTADAVCETLLIAHELGGTDIERRLAALIEDRVLDLQGRKDARAKQAGAKFARNFVLVVPLGMALVGQSIANGREAYGGPGAQIGVLVALGIIAGCWLWAGQLMKQPQEERVFFQDGTDA